MSEDESDVAPAKKSMPVKKKKRRRKKSANADKAAARASRSEQHFAKKVPTMSRRSLAEANAKREKDLGGLMLCAATALVAGLASVGVGLDVGWPLVVGGILGLVATIHYYGRLGATPPSPR